MTIQNCYGLHLNYLRMDDKPTKGTQHGDIYSFAIIFQEITLRAQPFSSNELTPEGNISYVVFTFNGVEIEQ